MALGVTRSLFQLSRPENLSFNLMFEERTRISFFNLRLREREKMKLILMGIPGNENPVTFWDGFLYFLPIISHLALLFSLTPLSALNICVKPLLPVSSLPIVRLQVQSTKSGYTAKRGWLDWLSDSQKQIQILNKIQNIYFNIFHIFLVLYLPWVIPARGVTNIVFREPILILPPVETNTCIFHHNSRFGWLHHIWYDFQHNFDASSKVNVLPLLSGFTAQLGDGEVLLPMVSPVQLARRRLAGSWKQMNKINIYTCNWWKLSQYELKGCRNLLQWQHLTHLCVLVSWHMHMQ